MFIPIARCHLGPQWELGTYRHKPISLKALLGWWWGRGLNWSFSNIKGDVGMNLGKGTNTTPETVLLSTSSVSLELWRAAGCWWGQGWNSTKAKMVLGWQNLPAGIPPRYQTLVGLNIPLAPASQGRGAQRLDYEGLPMPITRVAELLLSFWEVAHDPNPNLRTSSGKPPQPAFSTASTFETTCDKSRWSVPLSGMSSLRASNALTLVFQLSWSQNVKGSTLTQWHKSLV